MRLALEAEARPVGISSGETQAPGRYGPVSTGSGGAEERIYRSPESGGGMHDRGASPVTHPAAWGRRAMVSRTQSAGGNNGAVEERLKVIRDGDLCLRSGYNVFVAAVNEHPAKGRKVFEGPPLRLVGGAWLEHHDRRPGGVDSAALQKSSRLFTLIRADKQWLLRTNVRNAYNTPIDIRCMEPVIGPAKGDGIQVAAPAVGHRMIALPEEMRPTVCGLDRRPAI